MFSFRIYRDSLWRDNWNSYLFILSNHVCCTKFVGIYHKVIWDRMFLKNYKVENFHWWFKFENSVLGKREISQVEILLNLHFDTFHFIWNVPFDLRKLLFTQSNDLWSRVAYGEKKNLYSSSKLLNARSYFQFQFKWEVIIDQNGFVF